MIYTKCSTNVYWIWFFSSQSSYCFWGQGVRESLASHLIPSQPEIPFRFSVEKSAKDVSRLRWPVMRSVEVWMWFVCSCIGSSVHSSYIKKMVESLRYCLVGGMGSRLPFEGINAGLVACVRCHWSALAPPTVCWSEKGSPPFLPPLVPFFTRCLFPCTNLPLFLCLTVTKTGKHLQCHCCAAQSFQSPELQTT